MIYLIMGACMMAPYAFFSFFTRWKELGLMVSIMVLPIALAFTVTRLSWVADIILPLNWVVFVAILFTNRKRRSVK